MFEIIGALLVPFVVVFIAFQFKRRWIRTTFLTIAWFILLVVIQGFVFAEVEIGDGFMIFTLISTLLFPFVYIMIDNRIRLNEK